MSQEMLNIVTIAIAMIALIIAIITLVKVVKQTEYVRKQVFGEVYEQAQIKGLQFHLPERQKHITEGFEQKEDDITELGKTIILPTNCERELHLLWNMVESQTLRNFNVGFGGNFRDKPVIIDRTRAFMKKQIEKLPREEYIDWHGTYHCEFGYIRRLPKGEDFVCSVIAKTNDSGEYD